MVIQQIGQQGEGFMILFVLIQVVDSAFQRLHPLLIAALKLAIVVIDVDGFTDCIHFPALDRPIPGNADVFQFCFYISDQFEMLSTDQKLSPFFKVSRKVIAMEVTKSGKFSFIFDLNFRKLAKKLVNMIMPAFTRGQQTLIDELGQDRQSRPAHFFCRCSIKSSSKNR